MPTHFHIFLQNFWTGWQTRANLIPPSLNWDYLWRIHTGDTQTMLRPYVNYPPLFLNLCFMKIKATDHKISNLVRLNIISTASPQYFPFFTTVNFVYSNFNYTRTWNSSRYCHGPGIFSCNFNMILLVYNLWVNEVLLYLTVMLQRKDIKRK